MYQVGAFIYTFCPSITHHIYDNSDQSKRKVLRRTPGTSTKDGRKGAGVINNVLQVAKSCTCVN